MTHTGLKRRIRDALKDLGYLVTANPAGGGVLDLTVCADGRYIEIEVKVGKDRLSPLQRARIRTVMRAGGVAVECRSVDDALEACRID